MITNRARTTLGIGSVIGVLAALGALLHAPAAAACGGFFCGQQPVDQTAERILFEIGADSVTMTTQISFSGAAADFAWVLPLSEVPAADSLAVYRQQALNALDANTGPVFVQPSDPECYSCYGCNFGLPQSPSAPTVDADSSGVMVYIRQEVGDYDVAVISSPDPAELIAWLRTEGYRITAPMEPYIERYTNEGLKFLALKLVDTADVSDIQPFRFTLPGTAPTIPLRMTALAAEPEMSILAFVLADQRFEGKNWPNLSIDDAQIRFNPFNYSFGVSTNWAQLVAQEVDAAGGQGWVTEFAGPSALYAAGVRNQVVAGNFQTPDDEIAANDLLAALDAHPYLTRLYTRLSAEEMTSDPVLGRSALGDVDRQHQLSRIVNGIDQCAEGARQSTDPCDFTTCGAGGLCRPVSTPGASGDSSVEQISAGCACVPGATARATFAPDGVTPTVICQDGRMSFLNPGDRETPDAAVLPDTCAGFDCGEHGQCTAMNLTPTCVCDQGFVAIGRVDTNGVRSVTCTEPNDAVPAAFYEKRLPALPPELPGGRDVGVAEVLPPVTTPTVPTQVDPPTLNFPMPRGNPDFPSASAGGGGGGCMFQGSRGPLPASTRAAWLVASLLAAAGVRRRARRWH